MNISMSFLSVVSGVVLFAFSLGVLIWAAWDYEMTIRRPRPNVRKKSS